jgi:DNA-directed RNA polymerase specialized sigma24 family protein
MIQTFFEHYDLINERAWYFSKKYHLEYDDIQAQCFLIFVETYKKYDSTKSKFSTFLYNSVNIKLKNYCRKETEITKNNISFDHFIDYPQKDNHIKKFEFWDTVDNLSPEAQKIVNKIFYPQKLVTNTKVSKHSLLKEMRQETQLPHRKIKHYLDEIAMTMLI